MGSVEDDAARERLAMLGQIAAEIAHELRNVLQVISASAFVARQEVGRGDARAAFPHVTKIERNAHIAHAIVDDLMAMARGEPLHTEPLLLSELISAARTDLPPGCARWEDVLSAPDLRVRAHGGLFVRLLHGLYDNAIQASAPRPPSILTRAAIAEGRAIIDVVDDGPGVAEELAARLFDPLVTGRAGGTGFGLSLARRIATAHGGTIAFVAGRGVGATFRVALPQA
jgi:signal transduction histidine kinase